MMPVRSPSGEHRHSRRTAKIRGLRHLYANALGADAPPKLYKPYPNGNCLQCHGKTFKYLEHPVHVPLVEQLRNNEMSCIDCHGPVHPPAEGS